MRFRKLDSHEIDNNVGLTLIELLIIIVAFAVLAGLAFKFSSKVVECRSKKGQSIYSGPTATDKVIDTMQFKETKPCIGEKDDWYQVKLLGGKTGWVSGQYSLEYWKMPSWIAGASVTDEEGFPFSLQGLFHPEDHGLPIRSAPKKNAPVLRKTKQFESFSVDGMNYRGFIHVRMQKDGLIGWLEAKSTSGLSSKSGTFWKVVKDFFSILFSWHALGEIAGGVILGKILIAIFGHRLGEFLSMRAEMLSWIIVSLSTLAAGVVIMKVVPFDKGVESARFTLASGATMWRVALPVFVAIIIEDLTGDRREPAMAYIAMIFCAFAMYSTCGYAAGWWH